MTTAYFDAAAGQWKSTNTGIAPYGKCETEKHTDLILGGELSSADGSLRLFWIKPGAADNKFARFPTHSGLTVDPLPEPTFEVAPEGEIAKWNRTLDETNNIVTLNYYTGSGSEVIVYGSYPLNGKTYTTRLASNSDTAHYNTPYMFNGSVRSNCKNIKTIKFSNRIDTSNVTNMSYMFNQCNTLMTLDVSNFNTSNVIHMQQMFGFCSSLTSLDVSNFDTLNVTNMKHMFGSCAELTTLDLSNFKTSKVTSMYGMFHSCTKLTTLKVSEKWVIQSSGDTAYMFDYCPLLSSKPYPTPIS